MPAAQDSHQLASLSSQGAYIPPGEQRSNNTELLAGKLDPSAPNDVLIAIPPSSYMEYSPVAKLYTSRIYFTESQGGVLGANAMIGHDVLFDWERGRVGFAQSTCEHPEENEAAAAVEEAVEFASSNCALAEETLSQTCAESLDVDQCEHHPVRLLDKHCGWCSLLLALTTSLPPTLSQNRILRGVETWSMVVTDQGTQDGISCERTAVIKAAHQGREKPRITCDSDGTCTEHRPCQLKCADIPETQFKAVAKPKSASQKCSNSWSACDSSCTQTQVISELWTDGVCHEKDRRRRKCHTGACVKAHPCHVPFVVRTEIGFRGSKSWSRHIDEAVAAALIAAIGNEKFETQKTFGAGDVRVISTSPWIENSGEVIGKDYVAGTKAVIEISIVNLKLSPETDSSGVDSSGFVALAKGFRRSVQREKLPQCNDSELYPLAKQALAVKEILQSSSLLLHEVDKALGFESAKIISVAVSSSVKRDDEVIPLGSFSAGFHTHRLRQYAHHNPFMAVLFFLSVSFLVFGTCSAFEWALTVVLKKAQLVSQEKASDDTSHDTDTEQYSEDEDGILIEQLVSTASTTPEDNVSLSSDRDQDDMLERLFNCATGTPPRKVKEDADTPLRIPSFDQTHSLDESMDRSVSRGASPRKRKVDRQEVETDLEMARQKLERHV